MSHAGCKKLKNHYWCICVVWWDLRTWPLSRSSKGGADMQARVALVLPDFVGVGVTYATPDYPNHNFCWLPRISI